MPVPGENIYSWSTLAASNGTSDALINWAEGQPRASVNNSARSMMAALAKYLGLQGGPPILTGGSVNAYTFASGVGYTAVPYGLRVLLTNNTATNTGACTINMDGIGTYPIHDQNGHDLLGGEWAQYTYAEFLFDSISWRILQMVGRETVASNGDFSSTHNGALEVRGTLPILEFTNPGNTFTKIGLNSANKFAVGGGLWGTDRMTIDVDGNLTAAGDVNAAARLISNGHIITNGTVFASTGVYSGSGQQLALLDNSGERRVQFTDNGWRLAWNTTNAYLVYVSPTTSIPLSLSPGGDLSITGTGYRPGGGPWIDSSDARIKQLAGNYSTGLAEVVRLQPIRYSFKGNDTPTAPSAGKAVPYPNSGHYHAAVESKEFIGLIAQAAEQSMPELVTQASGYIDGAAVNDLRILDTTALTYALVNCVKELLARIEALEAKAPPASAAAG